MLEYFRDPAWTDLSVPLMWLIFGTLFPLFMESTSLEIAVKDETLYFRFFPIHFSFRRLPLSQIRHFEFRAFDPVGDFMGWGIRPWDGGGWAFVVRGNQGVELYLDNGRVLFLGLERPEELRQVLERADTGKS